MPTQSEMLPSEPNVVQFPAGQRVGASIELLHDIAPDCRHVSDTAKAFGLADLDPMVRHHSDKAMAEVIARHDLPDVQAARHRILDGLFQPLLQDAVASVRTAHAAARLGEGAQAYRYERVIVQGRYDPQVESWADGLTRQAAVRLIEAHQNCECAVGAWRAVSLALAKSPWTPRDSQPDHEWPWTSNAAEG